MHENQKYIVNIPAAIVIDHLVGHSDPPWVVAGFSVGSSYDLNIYFYSLVDKFTKKINISNNQSSTNLSV